MPGSAGREWGGLASDELQAQLLRGFSRVRSPPMSSCVHTRVFTQYLNIYTSRYTHPYAPTLMHTYAHTDMHTHLLIHTVTAYTQAITLTH